MLFDLRWLFDRFGSLLNRLSVFKVILLVFITHPHFLCRLLTRFLGWMFLGDFRRGILSLFELPVDLFVRSLIWTPPSIRVSMGVICFASLRLFSFLRPGRPNHGLIIGTMLSWGYGCLIIYYSRGSESRCIIFNTAFIAMCRRFSNMVFLIRIVVSLEWWLSFIQNVLSCILLCL